MKFKTVIITKKKILTAAVLIAVISASAAVICVHSGKTEETFSRADICNSILAEGLPSADEKKFSLKETVDKALGFNMDEPETIAAHELPYVEKKEEEKTEESTEVVAETPAPAPVTTPETVALPDKNAIYTSSGMEIRNATSYSVNADKLCAEPLPFAVDLNAVQILVMHTHTTECYNGDAMSGETERNVEETKNVVAVGNAMCAVFEEYGIKAVHDTTVHDYPSYQGAYTRALSTISANVKKYPDIKIVLDIHRDAFVYPDGSKLKVTCTQNGTSTAKVMLVAGTDSMGLSHPNWRGNLNFAAKIQNAANIMYPGLMRPIDLRRERFNMHMSPGSLLLEVGSNGNTLTEAIEGGTAAARAIAAVIINS